MFDPRTRHSREVLRDLLARYELPLIGPPVRKSIRFAESPTVGATLVGSGTDVPGTAAYRAIARELLGFPPDEDLLAAAGWTPEQRDDILGLTGVAEGAR
jgi:chromosome partitioning protein